MESKQETPTAEPLFGENDEGWSEPRVSTRTLTRTQRPEQWEAMTRPLVYLHYTEARRVVTGGKH